VSPIDQQSARSVPALTSAGEQRPRRAVWWRVPVVAFGAWLAFTVAASFVIPPRSLDTWAPLLLGGMTIGAISGGRAGRVRGIGDWAICVVVTFLTIVVFGYSLFVILVILLPHGSP
jgi:hypothetical protein